MSRSAPNSEFFNIIGNAIDLDAVQFTSNKKYTFYEPNWVYSLERLKSLKKKNPNFDVETMFLYAPQKDIVSGAVQDMQYWIDRKYVKWTPPNSIPLTTHNIIISKTYLGPAGDLNTLDIPKFDPTLGTLTSISVNIKLISADSTYTAVKVGDPSTNVPSYQQNTVYVLIFHLGTTGLNGGTFFSGSINPAIISIPPGQVTFDVSNNVDFKDQELVHRTLLPDDPDDPIDFTQFYGTGFVKDVHFRAFYRLTNDSGDVTFSNTAYLHNLTFEIRYFYTTPTVKVVQDGFLPSVFDQNSLSLNTIKVSENTFITPKFIPVFFAINNIKGKVQTIWTLTDVTDPDNPIKVIRVKAGSFFIWRFSTLGSFSLTAEVLDNKGNVFSDTVENLITVLSKKDYINFIERQLDSRKISLLNK